MREFAILAAATASVASASSLTFWRPGFQNNPSSALKWGFDTSTYPAYATILTSNPSTTIFALGCPTNAPTLALGTASGTCTWSEDGATYTIMDGTKHIAHQTGEDPSMSVWWSCDYNQVKTVMDCDMQIDGDVNDNTNGTVQFEFPDRFGNVVAFVTAEVVSSGSLATAGGSAATMSRAIETSRSGLSTADGSAPVMTATQKSGDGTAATASSTASGTVAASTGAAGGFGVDAVKLVGLVGGAAFAAW